jgi:hypothetical protein
MESGRLCNSFERKRKGVKKEIIMWIFYEITHTSEGGIHARRYSLQLLCIAWDAKRICRLEDWFSLHTHLKTGSVYIHT